MLSAARMICLPTVSRKNWPVGDEAPDMIRKLLRELIYTKMFKCSITHRYLQSIK